MKHVKLFLTLVTAVFCVTSFSWAEVKGKWGGAERIRYELWTNNFDMTNDTKDNRSYFRFKTSLWGDLRLTGKDWADELGLYAKMTNEFKPYTYYMVTSAPNNNKGLRGDINEFIFDNLYVDIKKPFKAPLNFRFGRQDFMDYGEGFLLMDGTPQDGSRTFYFNATKTTWLIDEKNTLDLLFIDNTRHDRWLPGFNKKFSPPTSLNNVDELGYVAYWKTKSIDKTALENYYIYKVEDGDKAHTTTVRVNTLGSFAKYDFSKTLTLRGQMAVQFGKSADADIFAQGGYLFADQKFDTVLKPVLTGGVAYLSGDDKGTEDVEGWNPLFSRFPWMSELAIANLSTETGRIAYWTNMQIYRMQLAISPMAKMKATATYNYLRANESATGVRYDDGRERGHLPQMRVDYAFTDNVKAYVLGEYYLPGSFHAEGYQDPALFLRTELSIKF